MFETSGTLRGCPAFSKTIPPADQNFSMPQQTLTTFSRYSKRILFGSVTVLSIVIAVAIVASGIEAFTQYRAQQVALFSAGRDTAASQANRLSARLMQFVDLLENRWHLEDEPAPSSLEHYRDALAAGNGATISGNDLTSTPFSIVTTLTRPEDSNRLSAMLRIVREMSILSYLDAQKPGITLSAEVFSPDGTFTATVPPLPDDDLDSARHVGAKRFIAARMASTNPLLADKSAAQLQAQRPQWAPQASARDAPVIRIVMPIFYDNKLLATIALSMPDSQFQQYFMTSERTPHFFVFDASAGRVLGGGQTIIDQDLLQTLHANRVLLAHAAPNMKVQYRDGTFFVTQRIQGPDWIAVSAFDWTDVLDSLPSRYLFGTLLYVTVALSMWAFAFYFSRYVLAPLQHRAQKAIEAEQFSRSIVDTLPIGIMVYAFPGGEVLLENAIATGMLDSGRPSAGQQFYNRLMHERHAAQLSSKDGPAHAFVEIDWLLSSGRTTYLGVASSRTWFHGQDVILLGLVDLNERKANEMLLAKAKQAADSENRAKSAFLAVMSHEVRTPLHGAIGNLELLAHSPLAADQRERVGTIQRTLDNLLSLANDILDVTSIEANALKISVAPTHLNEIVEYCAQTFAPTILGRSIELYCLTDPALDVRVEADEQRLTQVLQNLVGNAAKFTQEGSITLSVRVLHEEAQQTWVRFEVADTGIGIPAELQSTIFEPLTQADDTISRRFGGSGLGLFLCRNLVGLMGGCMTLASEPGKGSVFGVELPFKVLDAAGAVVRPAPAREPTLDATPQESAAALELLVVEDDPVSLTLIGHQLAALGYTRIQTARDGRDALRAWQERRPDVTLTDIGIPNLDGIGLLAEIRKCDSSAIVIATTAFAGTDIEMGEASFSHVLHKPVSLDDLRHVLNDVQHTIAQKATAEPSSQDGGVQRARVDPLHLALRDAFVESCRAVRPELMEALEMRDRQTLKRHLHRLQGTLSIMGYDEMAGECASLQALCAQGNWEILNGGGNALLVELDRRVDEVAES